MAKNLQFLNVNIYVITFFIDIFVVFVCIHRYVKLNSGKVGRNSRREATEGYTTSEQIKQIEDALQSVNALNTKYAKIAKTLKDLDEAKKKQIVENASLKAELIKSTNELKLLKKSLNDLEQYTRRDCLEIRGIPLPSTSTDVDQTDDVVLKIGEKIGVPMQLKEWHINK